MQVYVMVTWSRGQVRAIGFQIHFHGTPSRMWRGVEGEGVRVREMTRVAPRYGLNTGHPVYKVETRGGQVSLPVNLSVSQAT